MILGSQYQVSLNEEITLIGSVMQQGPVSARGGAQLQLRAALRETSVNSVSVFFS